LNSFGDGSISGTLNEPGDRDVVQIQLGVATTINIDLFDSEFESSFDPFVEVFDGDGTLIASDDDSGFGLSSRVVLDVEAGAYFISAGSYQNTKVGAYRLLVDARIRDDHAFTETLEVQEGTTATASGIIETVEDVDRFEVTLDRASTVNVSLTADRLEPQLRILDASGRQIAENSGRGGSQLTLELEAGVYQIEASAFDANSVGSYQLFVDRTAIEAPILELNDAGTASVAGHLQEGRTREFRLPVARAGRAVISLRGTSTKLDTRLTLLNELGEIVAENDDVGDSVGSRLDVVLDPGTYTVVAGTYNDEQAGDYVLDVSISIAGDADGDGRVGFKDFLIVSDNFTGELTSHGGKSFQQGDFDGDGDVDFDDFVRLTNNWSPVEATDRALAVWTGFDLDG
jgi:hypothetical protein